MLLAALSTIIAIPASAECDQRPCAARAKRCLTPQAEGAIQVAEVAIDGIQSKTNAYTKLNQLITVHYKTL